MWADGDQDPENGSKDDLVGDPTEYSNGTDISGPVGRVRRVTGTGVPTRTVDVEPVVRVTGPLRSHKHLHVTPTYSLVYLLTSRTKYLFTHSLLQSATHSLTYLTPHPTINPVLHQKGTLPSPSEQV